MPFVFILYIFVLPNRTSCRFKTVEKQTSNLAGNNQNTAMSVSSPKRLRH